MPGQHENFAEAVSAVLCKYGHSSEDEVRTVGCRIQPNCANRREGGREPQKQMRCRSVISGDADDDGRRRRGFSSDLIDLMASYSGKCSWRCIGH